MPNPVINRRLNSNTGPTTNGLLNSLISYWKFDTNEGATYNDDFGTNNLSQTSTTTGVQPGIINAGTDLHVGSSFLSHATNSDFDPGANTSISFSFWVNIPDWASTAGFVLLLSKGTGTAAQTTYEFYLDVTNTPLGRPAFVVSDASGPTFFGDYLTTVKPTGGVFHHIVGVFNSATKRVQGYFDGVLSFDEPTTSGTLNSVATQFQVGVGAGNFGVTGMVMDELAMWHKALTQTDVTNLNNAGAALPLSSYQH